MFMFNEAAGRIRVRAWLLAASILLLTACTSVAVPTVPVETPAPLITPSDAALVQPAQPAAAGTAEVLAFTVQESTFLSHIQNAAAEMGAPAAHRYIELSGADGALWQGERLAYADNEVWFLQPRAGDGSTAVRLDTPAGSDPKALAALLPQTAAVSGDVPNVVVQYVRARLGDGGAWSFDVTVAHPDTGWEDYADGWHVETTDGEILGTRILLHPHVDEQPFTRSLGGVAVPPEAKEVRIRAHDRVSGYGPAAVIVPLGQSAAGDRYEVIR